MTFCKVCGKLLPNVRFDPTEIAICQNCAEKMKEDLVRVVRCKDCKKLGTDVCPVFSPKNDWFCADGEKAQE